MYKGDCEFFCLFLVAAQMWTFSTLLPLMIGDHIPVDNPAWECFLALLRISKLCTARVISKSSTLYLAALIDQHHQEFRKCYPSVNMTPKTHYMVHIPNQILRYAFMFKVNNGLSLLCLHRLGPPISSWCMRMEAKNSYFKRIARIGNFKNVPLSVAKRHQRLLCANLQGKFFSYHDLQCGPCKQLA